MRCLFIIVSFFVLSACADDEPIKHAKWMDFCVRHDFTAKQCEVLYALKQSSDDASSSAETAGIAAGAALGASVGAASRR